MDPATSLAVAPDRVISLRYIMRNRHHELLENRMNGEPAVFLQGGNAILPGLQAQLEGMRTGEQKQVLLRLDGDSPEPDYFFEVEIVSVRAASTAELTLGYPLPVEPDCGPDCECYEESPAAGNAK